MLLELLESIVSEGGDKDITKRALKMVRAMEKKLGRKLSATERLEMMKKYEDNMDEVEAGKDPD